jgi:peptide/nickel transport system permease protein
MLSYTLRRRLPPATDPSWGAILGAGRAHRVEAPHVTLVPRTSIARMVIGVNLLGDGLRDWLSPR